MNDMSSAALESRTDILELVSEVVAAYVSRNEVSAEQLPEVIGSVHSAFRRIEGGYNDATTNQEPAVSVRKSVQPDYLICLEDGRKLKMLKRHLRTAYGMTPEDYRRKWGLPADYPMVAPNYAKQRSIFAKQIGLGRTGSRESRKAS